MIKKQAEYIARYVVEHFGLSLSELRGRSPLYRSEVRSLAVCLIYDLLPVTRQTATKLSGLRATYPSGGSLARASGSEEYGRLKERLEGELV